jgi:hypothetical protein
MKEKLEFPAFTLSLIEEGVVLLAFKKINEMKFSDLEDIIRGMKLLSSGEKMGMVMTFQGFIRINEELLADTMRKEIRKYVYASVYVIKSPALRLPIKFFMNFYVKNELPRNIAGTKEEAVAWLKVMKDIRKQGVLVEA